MSYSIFYRAMFIKMKDGSYIPMIESGDNNVWECDNRRRAREWCACRWTAETDEQRKRYSLSEEEIMAAAQHDVDKHVEEYAGKEPPFGGERYTKEAVLAHLDYFNGIHISGRSTTSAAQFLNFFKSGFRHAITMDDLGSGLRLSWYENDTFKNDTAMDEEELAEKWSKYQEQGIKLWITIGEGSAEYAWREVKSRTSRKRALRTEEGHYIIAFDYQGCERFLIKLTSRRMTYSGVPGYAHRYSSSKVAENSIKKLGARFPQLKNIRVETI